MSVVSFDCNCGYKARTQEQLNKHNNKCIIINNTTPNNVCQFCKKILLNKFSCDRHMLTCKYAKEIKNDIQATYEADKQNLSNIVSDIVSDVDKDFNMIQTLLHNLESSNPIKQKLIIESELFKKLMKFNVNLNNQQNNIDLTNNSNNNNNNTITNSNNNINSNNQITINNNNNISIVYPFGYENIYFLTDYEMLDILTSKNCLIKAMTRIYSHFENKNFMKRNINKEQMTIIDKELDIQVINDNEFKCRIIKHTFEALKRMFYHCKDKLKIEHQIMLWQNLRILNELYSDNNVQRSKEKYMHNEIRQVMDKITNIISADNERPGSKDIFAEIKNSMSNEEYKQQCNEKIKVIEAKIQEFTEDYKRKTIDEDFIKSNIWTQDLDNDLLLSIEHPNNDIRRYDVENTRRYIFFRDMEILENEYLDNDNNNTTGNIDSLCDFREQIADEELKQYDGKFNLSITERKTLERKVKNQHKYKARDKMDDTRKAILTNSTTQSALQSV